MSAGQLDDAVGPVEGRAGLVSAGAAATLGRIEAEVRPGQMSLGPLSPMMASLTLGEFLEGRWAGLRAVRGGRLEPISIALTVALTGGGRSVSRASPRSAAGPELDALFLGGGGRFGRVIGAVLRLVPWPVSERTAAFSFQTPSEAVEGLFAAIASGAWLGTAQLQPRGERFAFAASVIGSAESVDRDLATLAHEARLRGGRSCAHEAMAPPAPGAAEERELGWADVRSLLSGGQSVALFRLALESVLAIGAPGHGQPMTSGGEWANAEVWATVEATR